MPNENNMKTPWEGGKEEKIHKKTRKKQEGASSAKKYENIRRKLPALYYTSKNKQQSNTNDGKIFEGAGAAEKIKNIS